MSKAAHIFSAMDVMLQNNVIRNNMYDQRKFSFCCYRLILLDAGEPNQNGNEDCTAMDPQNEGYGVG